LYEGVSDYITKVINGDIRIKMVDPNEIKRCYDRELSELVASLNENILSGREDRDIVISSKERHPLYFDVEYHHATESVRSFPANLASASGSLRYTGTAKLVAQNHNCFNSNVEGISRPNIEPIPAKIESHHKLLKSMVSSPAFTSEFQDKCRKIWAVAYLRGRSLHVGEKYPLPESQFLEFKGAKFAECDAWGGCPT